MIKAAVDKWKNMCKVADDGGRPIYRPREWRRKERRLVKESKKETWHKSKDHVQVSGPLLLGPIPGPMIEHITAECSEFEMLHRIRVQVCQKAGQSVRTDAKPEPLRKTGYDRDDCLPCQSPSNRKGDCENNSVTYQITCETCLKQ